MNFYFAAGDARNNKTYLGSLYLSVEKRVCKPLMRNHMGESNKFKTLKKINTS